MLIACNWKCFLSFKDQQKLLIKIQNIRTRHFLIIFPSLESLGALHILARNTAIKLGAQNFWHIKGAYTGEAHYENLKKLGARYFLLNHVERKKLGEHFDLCIEKFKAALTANLKIILCLTDEEIFSNDCISKLRSAWLKLNPDFKVIFAYEPVSAVGGQEPAAPTQVEGVFEFLKNQFSNLRFDLLYGGSVDPSNVHKLKIPQLTGFLLGRSSTDYKKLISLIKAV
jgi:triosephosphate isomerase